MTREEARAALRVLDAQFASDTIGIAINRAGQAFHNLPISPADKAVGSAMFAGAVVMAIDDAFGEPAVQDGVLDLPRAAKVLRATADLYDALYRAGKN